MTCNTLNPSGHLDDWAWNPCNRITFSSLTEYKLEAYNAPTYSIKYVLEGTEHYLMKGRKFAVSAKRYLLVNKDQPVDLWVHSKKNVLGFCIHLEERLLRDVFTHLIKNESWLLDNPAEQLWFPKFEELLYSDKENRLGQYLENFASHFNPKAASVELEENEAYYNLACHLLQLQNSFTTGSEQISVLRSSTKNELLRRLALAKELIDTNISECLDVEEIARRSMLSSSHLFRNFKKVYGISPYQYFLQTRMKQAAHLLSTKKMLITEAAFEFGFPDLASFSKAFKKAHRLSPIQYLKAG